MSGEMPMGPEDMGIESEQTGAETTSAVEQDVPTEIPVSGGETGSLGGESTGSSSQTETAKKPTPHTAPKPPAHPSAPSGEGLFDNFKKLAEGVEEESGLGNMTK